MSIKIVKRSGLKDDYDLNKIFNVLLKAATHIGYTVEDKTLTPELLKDLNEITGSIDDEIQDEYANSEIPVSVVQNIVMDHLLNSDYKDIAKEYISYSAQREQIHKDMMNTEKAVDRVLSKDPSVVNENGNKDSRKLPTQRDLIAGQVFKAKGLEMLPKDVREAHIKGDIHVHDMDYSPLLPYTNCCNVNLEDMLENGFHMGEVYITQPHSLDVAVQLASQILVAVSTQQYGGTSLPNVDQVFAPYAKMNYDKHLKNAMKYKVYDPENVAWELTKHDIYEDMQGFEFSINSMCANSAQVPFSTVSFGLGTDKFSREIQLAMLKVREEGLSGHTAVFPKLLYFVTKGINYSKSDPNYDIKQEALRCTSLRDYPDIVFSENILNITGGKELPMTFMGCRSALPTWINPDTGLEQVAGRCNLGVVTLNIPRIAMESGGNKDKFWSLFKQRVELVHKALRFRIDRVLTATPETAPILYMEGALGRLKPEDDIKQLFTGGRATASFGYIGLYEMNTVFYGSNWEHNQNAIDFAQSVVQYIKDKCNEWYKEEDFYYSVYSTPSESLTDRFCRLDTRKFGIVKDITDKGYINNSFHYDVRKDVTPFEKVEFEAPYQHIASGGFISYTELPNIKHNLSALEAVWDYANEVGIGYLGTNVPIDTCTNCGFHGQCIETNKGWKCPECGATEGLQIITRLCGYLGEINTRPVVKGRMNEIEHRVHHNLSQLGVAMEEKHVIKRE
jgi:anaerobic ribonucleoside-triphosphate reductase